MSAFEHKVREALPEIEDPEMIGYMVAATAEITALTATAKVISNGWKFAVVRGKGMPNWMSLPKWVVLSGSTFASIGGGASPRRAWKNAMKRPSDASTFQHCRAILPGMKCNNPKCDKHIEIAATHTTTVDEAIKEK
jgi:hypothetical protein